MAASPRGRTRRCALAVEWVEQELAHGDLRADSSCDAVDRRWENREDPDEHIFTNPGPPGPPVVLYRAAE